MCEDDEPYCIKYTVTLPPEPTGRCSKALQVNIIGCMCVLYKDIVVPIIELGHIELVQMTF